MKKPIWIPPLVSITIMLYFTAGIMLVFNYYMRDTVLITIAFGMMVVGSISLAVHINFKYGDNNHGKKHNQKIHGSQEGTCEARKVD